MSALFLFASLGVINGILLSSYLLANKNKSITEVYFAGLILALSLRIGKSVLMFFDRDLDKTILQIGLSACLFIGPFFYLYTRSLQQDTQVAKKQDKALLFLLLIAVIVLGVILPYRTHPEFWNGYMVKGIYAVWSFFVLLGLYNNRAVFAQFFHKPAKLKEEERYILGIALSVVFITITYQFALYVEGLTYIWGSIIFSVSFYYLAGRKLLAKKALTPKSTPSLDNAKALLQRVETMMVTKKTFKNPKLKLDELAEHAGMSRHLLSRLLNEEYKHGFSHYIKTHRVNEAKNLIEFRHDLSLEGIGFEAGFNSKSAFFEAFKKVTQLTPAAYKKSLEGQK